MGAHHLEMVPGGFRNAAGTVVRAGERITIDGSTGRVWLGDLPTTKSTEDPSRLLEHLLPELALLEDWAENHPTTGTES